MQRAVTLLTVSLLALGSLQPALAGNHQNKDRGQGKDQSHREQDAGDLLLDVAITAAETAIIDEFIRAYGVSSFGAPQGLPPGIAKNLARGKPLPPGIAKRYLPGSLLARLPARPGYEWLVVDNDILLVVAATAVLVDVLADAF
jgi:Ni/Co efflux regulator RcnB